MAFPAKVNALTTKQITEGNKMNGLRPQYQEFADESNNEKLRFMGDVFETEVPE
jgi:hypothetical protein